MGIFSITFDLGYKPEAPFVVLIFELQALLTLREMIFYTEMERIWKKC